ncbi:glycosyltransferase family 2 protein [Alkanindiges illinoisensis]|uniref:glycosyltransferase family 2 protein n=1 Tax=Alkanindiges illinoisensis TaxID=197183 RepID=UPI00068455C4|nr:hypothetical protein [Alkanindiges illinoisensis]
MIEDEKIGVAIITYNRPDGLEKLFNSLPHEFIDCFIIINDGKPIVSDIIPAQYISNNIHNLGVGKSKNKALKYLMDNQMDHYFIFEDDVHIINQEIFHAYIQASKTTGIHHFNSALHVAENKKSNGQPNPLIKIIYPNDVKISFYFTCCGVFSYYSKKCLLTVGLMDEQFFNAAEHIDHTLRCSQMNMHSDFWYFADISDSYIYLKDTYNQENYQSVILVNSDSCQVIKNAKIRFNLKYQINSVKEIEINSLFKFINNLNTLYNKERKQNEEFNLIKKNLKELIRKFPIIFGFKLIHDLNRIIIKCFHGLKKTLLNIKKTPP